MIKFIEYENKVNIVVEVHDKEGTIINIGSITYDETEQEHYVDFATTDHKFNFALVQAISAKLNRLDWIKHNHG